MFKTHQTKKDENVTVCGVQHVEICNCMMSAISMTALCLLAYNDMQQGAKTLLLRIINLRIKGQSSSKKDCSHLSTCRIVHASLYFKATDGYQVFIMYQYLFVNFLTSKLDSNMLFNIHVYFYRVVKSQNVIYCLKSNTFNH